MRIILPYRNRPDHLAEFCKRMKAYLPHASILVVEQSDAKPFNRGKLLNIGALECDELYFVFHDVDMVPVSVNYTPRLGINQLAGSEIQPYGYLGGVTMFDRHTFYKSGGYNNDYFHRAEDNEMIFNLKRLHLRVKENHGKFEYLPHERKSEEFIPWLWAKAQLKRKEQNQLSICTYKLIGNETNELYRKITVEI